MYFLFYMKGFAWIPLDMYICIMIFLFRDLIDSVVAIAENTADELIRNQGQEVILEEDPQLQLPFLLPEDRYSCEVIRGVPPGLKEFLNPLAGIGQLVLYLKMIIIVSLTMASQSGGGCPGASTSYGW